MSTALSEYEKRQRQTEILISRSSAADALKALYHLACKNDSKVSLNWLCHRTGIPTKGNLSDVFQGRRKLKSAYRPRLVAALGLKGIHATYLLKMMEHDFSRDENAKREVESELKLLNKTLQIDRIERAFPIDSFSVTVFCSLGLFENRAKLKQLIRYFGAEKTDAVVSALDQMIQGGFVIQKDGVYSPASAQVNFFGSSTEKSQMDFLKQGFTDVPKAIDHFFDDPRSHFESTIISVRQKDYVKILEDMKHAMLKYQAQLESDSADLLIRVNLAVYPVK